MFPNLNLPLAQLKIKRKNEGVFVWDIFRRKEVVLTPEEWVRQQFFHYLINCKNVPQGLLASEYSIDVNSMKRRCDGVLFSQEMKPVAIIECKAADVKLTEETMFQIAQYNFTLKVQWLILTNGIQTITCFLNLKERKLSYLEEVPDYRKMLILTERS